MAVKKTVKKTDKRKPAKRAPQAGRTKTTKNRAVKKEPNPVQPEPKKSTIPGGSYFPHKKEKSAPMTIMIEEQHMVISDTGCHCCSHNYFCMSDYECLSCGVRRGEKLKPYKGW